MAKEEKSLELYKQAQRRLIASLLYDSSELNRVVQILESEDFEEPALELIYLAILELSRQSSTVSAISIAHELEKAGKLKEAGGPPELYLLRDEGSKYLQEAPLELYAQIVKESSAKSKITKTLKTHAGHFKVDSGKQAADSISELQADLNEALYKLSDDSTSVDLSEHFAKYEDKLEERKLTTEENLDAGEGLQGIPSLLPSINYYTGGWQAGQMITIGARTGIGKSIFAVNSAVAAAQAGKSVLFFSLEMNEDELQDRIVASVSGISLNRLKRGTLTDEDREALKECADEISSMKIRIETEAKVTVDSMRAKALEMAQSEKGLDFIILDYLQLVTATARTSSRQEALADISRNVKLMAKQLGVPVMVLVQVNRESNDEENPVPKMHQIRESGAIAQDSDIVILLHREEALDDTIPHTLVLLEKNRQGEAQKTIRCHSNLECSVFREVTKAKDVARINVEEQEAAIDDLDLDDFSEFDDDFDPEELF